MLLLLFHFCSGSSKTEEAAELYVKAANAFKMAKKWAGNFPVSALALCLTKVTEKPYLRADGFCAFLVLEKHYIAPNIVM